MGCLSGCGYLITLHTRYISDTTFPLQRFAVLMDRICRKIEYPDQDFSGPYDEAAKIAARQKYKIPHPKIASHAETLQYFQAKSSEPASTSASTAPSSSLAKATSRAPAAKKATVPVASTSSALGRKRGALSAAEDTGELSCETFVRSWINILTIAISAVPQKKSKAGDQHTSKTHNNIDGKSCPCLSFSMS